MSTLEHLLDSLHSHQLVTILAPSKRHDRREWDCIRVNVDTNVKWCRDLCAANPSQRGTRHGKFDTAIRRRNIIRALERMIDGKSGGVYEQQLREIAMRQSRLTG